MNQSSPPAFEPKGTPPTMGDARLCPYCGHAQFGNERCQACGGHFDVISLKLTQVGMGPWFVRDAENPFRPGCSYGTLEKIAHAGKLKPKSVIRGPTTQQFWSLVQFTPGVAHLVGLCHQCQTPVKPTDPTCPHCKASFKRSDLKDRLGLAFATQDQANTALAEILAEQKRWTQLNQPPPAPAASSLQSPITRKSLVPGSPASSPVSHVDSLLGHAPPQAPTSPPSGGVAENLLGQALGAPPPVSKAIVFPPAQEAPEGFTPWPSNAPMAPVADFPPPVGSPTKEATGVSHDFALDREPVFSRPISLEILPNQALQNLAQHVEEREAPPARYQLMSPLMWFLVILNLMCAASLMALMYLLPWLFSPA